MKKKKKWICQRSTNSVLDTYYTIIVQRRKNSLAYILYAKTYCILCVLFIIIIIIIICYSYGTRDKCVREIMAMKILYG